MQESEVKLLPCPFCGGAAHLEEIKGSPFKQAVVGITFSRYYVSSTPCAICQGSSA